MGLHIEDVSIQNVVNWDVGILRLMNQEQALSGVLNESKFYEGWGKLMKIIKFESKKQTDGDSYTITKSAKSQMQQWLQQNKDAVKHISTTVTGEWYDRAYEIKYEPIK